MWSFFKELLKQNHSVILLVFGSFLAGVSCVTVGQKDTYVQTHDPRPLALFVLGTVLIVASLVAFGYAILRPSVAGGLDLSTVTEDRGAFSTKVDDCEIRVVKGRLEDYSYRSGSAVVLPCNEYFDDECAADTRSALGAYVNNIFQDRCSEFVSLVRERRSRVFGAGVEREKTKGVRAESFGVGLCLLLERPLGHNVPIALLSTTTQVAQEGLVGSVSYLFDGMKDLFRSMADARLNEVVMPLLGSGHGGVDRPIAFIGLLIAIAEAARRGHGGHRERKVTIVVYRRDDSAPAEVDDVIIRRGLALVGSKWDGSSKASLARQREPV